MVLILTPGPAADAGSDETICQGDDFDLSTSTTLPSAADFSSLSWSSSGDGTFSDPSALTPIYSPGATDISAGSVTLTLTANGNGPCDPTSDAMVLTLTSEPSVDAGSDEAICQGDDFDFDFSTSGMGLLVIALTPIYSPGAAAASHFTAAYHGLSMLAGMTGTSTTFMIRGWECTTAPGPQTSHHTYPDSRCIVTRPFALEHICSAPEA
jgi:hypothetical protein